ncbi:hypothetical protein TNCV_1721181 [Trichonephila clavipes]|nr:hypothetical protein TNCV_1721181 [Trichonephila clavipes]
MKKTPELTASSPNFHNNKRTLSINKFNMHRPSKHGEFSACDTPATKIQCNQLRGGKGLLVEANQYEKGEHVNLETRFFSLPDRWLKEHLVKTWLFLERIWLSSRSSNLESIGIWKSLKSCHKAVQAPYRSFLNCINRREMMSFQACFRFKGTNHKDPRTAKREPDLDSMVSSSYKISDVQLDELYGPSMVGFLRNHNPKRSRHFCVKFKLATDT